MVEPEVDQHFLELPLRVDRAEELGLRQLPFGLVERRPKRPRVNLEEQLTLLDECPFLVALAQKVAGDLRPDIGVCETVERADPLAINRNIPLLNLHDLDIGRAALRCSRCML